MTKVRDETEGLTRYVAKVASGHLSEKEQIAAVAREIKKKMWVFRQMVCEANIDPSDFSKKAERAIIKLVAKSMLLQHKHTAALCLDINSAINKAVTKD